MGKPTICIGKTKAQMIAKLISAFVFATQIVQFLLNLAPKFQASSLLLWLIVQFLLNLAPKFQASSLLLWLYCSVCVRPVQKPHCWFSHEAAHISVAPIKALCSERYNDWKDKLEPLGLKCMELTGDTEVDDFYR